MAQALALFLGFICTATQGGAQESKAAIIENTNEATVYAAPTEAAFWLHLSAKDASVAEAMAVATGFEKKLRERLKEAGLHPIAVSVSAPAVTSVDQKTVCVAAKLTFAAGPFTQPDTGPKEFAQLCDGLATIAGALGCTVSGPLMDTPEKQPILRDAIAAAIANAYPGAETAAETLGTAVYEIVKIEILEVTWNHSEVPGITFPTLRNISCTARVKVIYTLNP